MFHHEIRMNSNDLTATSLEFIFFIETSSLYMALIQVSELLKVNQIQIKFIFILIHFLFFFGAEITLGW